MEREGFLRAEKVMPAKDFRFNPRIYKAAQEVASGKAPYAHFQEKVRALERENPVAARQLLEVRFPERSDVAPEEVDLALSYFQRRLYPQGKPIFYQGDLGQALYLVASGKVRLFRTHLGGQERTLALLGPGELFGEMSLLDEGERSASAVAVEDTELLALFREDYLALIRRLPLVAHNLAALLARRLREADLELDLLSFEEARNRVAYALLKLLRQGLGPLFQIRHHELAALAGTSRETVSRVLHALAEEGVVRLGPGTVEVREAALLEEIAFGLA